MGEFIMGKIFKLLFGVTLSSLSIAMVINSNMGAFAITSCNLAISSWMNIPLSVAGILVEILMISFATYKGEGLGLTAICNATYGSIMIDVFRMILPQHAILCIGLLTLPVSWVIIGRVGWGDTGGNILMNALLKSTGKSVRLIRTIEELVFISIGFMGARNYVTIFSIIITLLIGPIAQFIYKLFKYDPTTIKQKYLIKMKN
jgi:uncharacterized membrane protein YczE